MPTVPFFSPEDFVGGRLVRLLIVLSLSLAMLACGSGDGPPTDSSKIEFEVLTRGEVVDMAPYIKTGTITVFDFYADWCPPCIKLNRSLKDMKGVYGDRITIYKLDLVSWESALAAHHGIKDLPYLMIYGNDGKLLTKGPSIESLPKLLAELDK